jgi:ribulose 1,5-bisphosphate synthetase/thiazole synthase
MATGHITQALWSTTTAFRTYPQLSGNIEVNVAIVGEGISGISMVYTLAKAGKRVAVLEGPVYHNLAKAERTAGK